MCPKQMVLARHRSTVKTLLVNGGGDRVRIRIILRILAHFLLSERPRSTIGSNVASGPVLELNVPGLTSALKIKLRMSTFNLVL